MKISLYPKYFLSRLLAKGKKSFFSDGYRYLYPECGRHGLTPWQHFVLDGRRKGFDNGNHPPEEMFFREGYEAEYPDVKAAGLDPWHHYILNGKAEGRDNGLNPDVKQFFAEGYLEMYPDVAMAGVDPWRHYVLNGKSEGRDNGLHPDGKQFFPEGYLEMYPDVAMAGVDPWRHYVLNGKAEGRDNGLHPDEKQFFAEGYLEMYPDVALAKIDPWRHYVLNGKAEGRDSGLHPSEDVFSASLYLKKYKDAAESGMDPWHHFVRYGKKDGRTASVTPYKYARAYGPWWYLDRTLIDDRLRTFAGKGIHDNKNPIIVSLTSFPARINEVKYSVYSLLNQTLKPDKVVLWLAAEQFPNKEKDLPDSLLKLRENGLSVEWCDDLKSYKKLVPSLQKYPDACIATADDDLYYPENWLQSLYEEHLLHPTDIVAHRCHCIGMKDGAPQNYSAWKKCIITTKTSVRLFPTTGGGVSVSAIFSL